MKREGNGLSKQFVSILILTLMMSPQFTSQVYAESFDADGMSPPQPPTVSATTNQVPASSSSAVPKASVPFAATVGPKTEGPLTPPTPSTAPTTPTQTPPTSSSTPTAAPTNQPFDAELGWDRAAMNTSTAQSTQTSTTSITVDDVLPKEDSFRDPDTGLSRDFASSYETLRDQIQEIGMDVNKIQIDFIRGDIGGPKYLEYMNQNLAKMNQEIFPVILSLADRYQESPDHMDDVRNLFKFALEIAHAFIRTVDEIKMDIEKKELQLFLENTIKISKLFKTATVEKDEGTKKPQEPGLKNTGLETTQFLAYLGAEDFVFPEPQDLKDENGPYTETKYYDLPSDNPKRKLIRKSFQQIYTEPVEQEDSDMTPLYEGTINIETSVTREHYIYKIMELGPDGGTTSVDGIHKITEKRKGLEVGKKYDSETVLTYKFILVEQKVDEILTSKVEKMNSTYTDSSLTIDALINTTMTFDKQNKALIKGEETETISKTFPTPGINDRITKETQRLNRIYSGLTYDKPSKEEEIIDTVETLKGQPSKTVRIKFNKTTIENTVIGRTPQGGPKFRESKTTVDDTLDMDTGGVFHDYRSFARSIDNVLKESFSRETEYTDNGLPKSLLLRSGTDPQQFVNIKWEWELKPLKRANVNVRITYPELNLIATLSGDAFRTRYNDFQATESKLFGGDVSFRSSAYPPLSFDDAGD